jgi:hypothetical protein
VEELDRFLRVFQQLQIDPFAVDEYRRALGIQRILSGETTNAVATELRLSKHWLRHTTDAVAARGLSALVPHLSPSEQDVHARRLGIAQMLLGTLAERRFILLSDEITGGGRLYIEDHVRARTDTDFRILNGQRKPVCRMNIKFHGTLFQRAQEIVSLPSDDCFALATYKIYNALRRQEQEALPYVFFVLSIRDLSAASIAPYIPEEFVWLLSVLAGRRAVEEAIVSALSRPEYESRFQSIFDRMAAGEFRIISASKAYALLSEKLFDRVFALRIPRFNRNYRNAEIDMHFSLSRELTPLVTFLEIVARESVQVLNVRLYRGDI